MKKRTLRLLFAALTTLSPLCLGMANGERTLCYAAFAQQATSARVVSVDMLGYSVSEIEGTEAVQINLRLEIERSRAERLKIDGAVITPREGRPKNYFLVEIPTTKISDSILLLPLDLKILEVVDVSFQLVKPHVDSELFFAFRGWNEAILNYKLICSGGRVHFVWGWGFLESEHQIR
jgi:hypothetical protein